MIVARYTFGGKSLEGRTEVMFSIELILFAGAALVSAITVFLCVAPHAANPYEAR
ncbi:MAG: hypothetical protein R3C03_22295 [Pirellulaceae bacterium]